LPNASFGEKSTLEDIHQVSITAKTFTNKAKELVLSGQGEAAYRLLRFEFRPTQNKWWSLLQELVLLEESRNSQATIEANHAYDYGQTLILTFGGAAFLFSIVAAYLTTRTEKRLQASEQAFRTLVENSPDMIIRFDKYYRRVLINPAYYRETGIAQGEDQDKTPDQSWWNTNISGEEYKAKLRQVMETNISTDILMEWDSPDGQRISHSVRIVPEHGSTGEIIGTLAIGRNITALREAERQLKRSHDQLHALSVHREVVQEEERKNIARELHDELGQILTALHMNVSVLRLKFGKAYPPLMVHIKSLAAMVETTMQVVRRVVSSLRPTALDMGIVSALEWLTDEFTAHSGIACKLTLEEKELVLDEAHALAIFRIVQESLTNVARHARASQVEIILIRQGITYFLNVRDNGTGFDTALSRRKSFGLAGAEERAVNLGGKFAVFSRVGQGTSVEAHFPINEIQKDHD
jgi:PAS domain S-box-containing protein